MSHSTTYTNKASYYLSFLKQAIRGEEMDYTTGSIRKAVIMLAIPMVLEMIMESVFALVDLYFVGHLPQSDKAQQVVGLAESVITIIYSIAIGISMAATALVARRIGEKDPEEAAKAGAQTTTLSIIITVVLSIAGFIFAKDILRLMGASAETVEYGANYTRILTGGSIVIMLLFLINGIFRGAGDASMAMRSLTIANIANIILCPLLIRGLGPVPAFGLTGAAMATTIGRGIGVMYQLYHLFNGKSIIKMKASYFIPVWEQVKKIIGIAAPGTLQFLIGSGSWIVLTAIVAQSGETASAGYITAIRVIMFFLLPAWGLSNAAATLVGQNLGAKQPQRAEESVLKTAKYNAIFMGIVTLLFLLLSPYIIGFFAEKPDTRKIAVEAMLIISSGYIFYGVGMVMMNAFNGAGDTRTPTIINAVGFWLFQIPLAIFLSKTLKMGATGAFIAIPAAETAMAIAFYILFRKGKWKQVKV
ncbi:MAG: MATE family efflux transporter [Chitinophagaceae bacterium]|nr:MATE family efflux transporter [Chitinophagaceae bacterium]